MTGLGVTADANLLTSGAVRRHPDAAPVRFLDGWRAGRFTLILSDHLLTEVERALAKPYFLQRLSEADRREFPRVLWTEAVITPLTVTVTGVATQSADDLVLATAISGGAGFLVTGDHKLLALKSYQGVIILSVHEFLAMLPGLRSDDLG